MKRVLEDNWFLAYSEDIVDSGEEISEADYNTDKWYRTKIPGTVMSTLVDNGVYDDPYYGLNLEKSTGFKKRRDIIFSLQKKPKNSPFRNPWWYRREFNIENEFKQKRIWLNFRGINYSANIWLNGKKIFDKDYVKGTFRLYDFDVTDFILFGKINTLAVEVFSPGPYDLALTFIDWAPGMPDDNMGIWQPVVLYSTGPAALKNIFVHTEIEKDTFNRAEIKIETDIINTYSSVIDAEIKCEIEEFKFCKNITLMPLSKRKVIFSSTDFPGLRLKNPRLWWPYQLGSPQLYKLKTILRVKKYGNPDNKSKAIRYNQIDIRSKDEISDSAEVTFGIRDIKAFINEYGSRQFIVNGKKILIRGAAWTPDLMLRQSERQDEIDTDFIVNLNLNAIRLEGKLATDYLWNLCDKKGIMVIAGWPCCNHFEKWRRWKSHDINIASESERSQILRLRNHPSFITWLYGSDFPPPENVEKVYLKVIKETYKNLPAISSASHKKSKLSGITGFKMRGPYSYVPPVYWYDRSRAGYAGGFNTETCPDICIPFMESLKKMMPVEQIFNGSTSWNHHAGVGRLFNNTKRVDVAITKRYGKPEDMDSYIKTAQVMGYESWRAMYEAHNRNFPEATGIIGWMLNSPWPSLIWQLYDYYSNPTGAFFGTKKACEPLHIQYSYDDYSIWIVNNGQEDYSELEISINVYNFDLTEKLSKKMRVGIRKESKKKVFKLPDIHELSKVYFLSLYIKKGDTVKSRQLYWLTKDKDIFTGKDSWYQPHQKTHADMSMIRNMPRTSIDISYDVERKDDNNYYIDINVKNGGKYIAFFIWIKLYGKKTGEILAPVFWSDNCIFIFPGESVSINAIMPVDVFIKDITSSVITSKNIIEKYNIDEEITVKAEGWNC